MAETFSEEQRQKNDKLREMGITPGLFRAIDARNPRVGNLAPWEIALDPEEGETETQAAERQINKVLDQF